MSDARRYCTFSLDDRCFGIEVERVQEVLRRQELTRVPLAPEVIRGLINLRGQIVTALDLRRRLDLPPRAAAEPSMNVVVRGGEEPVSLLVDDIGDVVEVSAADFERPPDTLEGAARDIIRGCYELDDRLLLVLDTDKALDVRPDRD